MTPRPQSLRSWLALLVLTTLVVVPDLASAASFDPNDTGWEGTRGFVDVARESLGGARIWVVDTLDWSLLTPQDGLVVIHPERTVDGDEMAAFLRAGGRVAVIDDFGMGDRIVQRYGVKRGPAPREPLLMLRSNPQLAIAEPVRETAGGRTVGVHPVVADVTRLVTNHATTLTHPDLSVVLRIRARDDSDAALAVAGQVGKGRLFAMGDPSAVMNLMLRYSGNRAFADGLVKYLVDDDVWGARQGKLYFVSNRFSEKGAFGGGTSSGREVKELVKSLESEVRKIEGDGLPKALSLALAVVCLGAVAMWVFAAAARRYQRPAPRIASGAPLVAQGGVAGRAVVLAAPSTHRGLILLEQKTALEERAGALLGLEKTPSMAMLLEELETRNLLDPDTFRQLKRTLLDMAHVETAVLAGSPIRVTNEQLAQAEQLTQRVCELIEKKSDLSPPSVSAHAPAPSRS